jgi:hypothetical protein
VALAAHDMLLLRQYNVEYLTITFALINAAVVTKVIMIGEYAKLGRRHEDKALLISAVWKAFVFGLLVFGFHVVEEVIKRLIHGEDLARASRQFTPGTIRRPCSRGVLRVHSAFRVEGIPARHG